jgi:hypothetical protein
LVYAVRINGMLPVKGTDLCCPSETCRVPEEP